MVAGRDFEMILIESKWNLNLIRVVGIIECSLILIESKWNLNERRL